MFKCEICGKEFEEKKGLMGHMGGAHKRSASLKDDRKKRVPVGIKRKNLDAEIVAGKVRRWVNDDPGRLQRFLDGGYDFVKESDATDTTNVGTRKSRIVDKGTGKLGYLMEIDKDLYDEDQAAKQKKIDRVEDAIKHGRFENKLGDAGYNAGIKYEP